MITKRLKFVALAVFLCIVAPVASTAAWYAQQGWPASWRTADWSASGIAPDPRTAREAIIQVYAARAGRWKGMFAVHTWIVLKREGADSFTRYEVVGWGNPVRRNAYPTDGRWYSNVPDIIHDVRGDAAAALIPRIEAAITRYPHSARGAYSVWPGPNSNSFVAWVARNVPELGAELPPTAVGKDYLGEGFAVETTPSGTGWQISLSGVIGAGIGVKEGLELHILGGTLGIDPQSLAVKLPSVGTLSISRIWAALVSIWPARVPD